MNCFNHRDKSALAICKSCGRALCADCSTALRDGIACKNTCESRVNAINEIADDRAYAKKIQGFARWAVIIMGVVWIIISLISKRYLLLPVGLILLIGGYISIQKRADSKHSPDGNA
jgi:hypothetical protein